MRRAWVIGGTRRAFEDWRSVNSNQHEHVAHIWTTDQLQGIEIRPDDGDIVVRLGALDQRGELLLPTRIRPGKRA